MKPQSTTVEIVPFLAHSHNDTRSSIIGMIVVCNNEDHQEEVKNIIRSGPVQITRLAPLTTQEINEEVRNAITDAKCRYYDSIGEHQNDDNPDPEQRTKQLILCGNALAEELHAIHDWKHDQLLRLKE